MGLIKVIKFFITLSVFICLTEGAKLEQDWKPCKLKDPELSECFRIVLEKTIRRLIDGNRTLGILPLDPFHLTTATTYMGGDGPIDLKIVLNDLDMIGLKDATIPKLKLNVKNDLYDVHLTGFVPKFTVLGKYKLKGRILMLPITDVGEFKVNAVDYSASIHTRLIRIKEDDKEYFQIVKYELLSQDFGKVEFQFNNNLFNGNNALNDSINKFFNANWKMLTNEINEFLKPFGQLDVQVGNKIFKTIPADELILV